MKMLLCSDVRLDVDCTENLEAELYAKWQEARKEKFADLVDKTLQNNAAYLALFGRMFGRERIPESVVDRLFQAVREESEIRVLAFLSVDEFDRIAYRSDIPENLNLFCPQKQDSFVDDNIALGMFDDRIELQLADNDTLFIRKNTEGWFVISGLPEDGIIPSFEPVGFEEAQGATFGYGMVEWADEEIERFSSKADQKYAFRTMELKIEPSDDQKEILRKISTAAKSLDYDTFLRVTLSGSSAFGLTINGDALKNQLQNRAFFVEVYDNTVMDINAEAFEGDISLRGEFVRLALQDDTLSEAERNRLISCGWNALNGKEVSAE